jgi:glycyl-tRNA synthetase beta chain
LEVRATDRGERLCAVHRKTGSSTAALLPEILSGLIKKIPFAKNMVWEESRFSFARPIRWIVALFGTQAVKFSIAGVKSGKKTWGLTLQSAKPLDVPAPARYVSMLRDRCVIVDPAERRALIEKQVQQTVRAQHGHVPMEKFGALLDEVTHLVEHPVAILGKFDPRYLALPAEVLVTSMKKHQKFFPVFGPDGKLLPYFVGIRNGISENQGVVREGYERVLSARLSDAAFFFEQDRKTKLEEKAAQLKSVLFQKALGSVWDKTNRTVQLTGTLGERLSLSREIAHQAPRIAFLSKADLVTAMVGEFPELQGVMGRIYAEGDGEDKVVAAGVEQHYWPLTADGELPKSDAAAAVSVADKLDTLAGDFHIGLVPSGSQDPYGLRRAAVGVIRILQERKWQVHLPELIEAAVALVPASAPGDAAKTRQLLLEFFKQRWAALMEAKGFRFDEVQAVAAGRFGDVVDAERRLEALQEIRKHADFTPLSVAFKRADNILSQARKKGVFSADVAVREEHLKDDAERELFDSLKSVEGEVAPILGEKRYADALRSLVKLRPTVDRFFEKVMVMAPEQELRSNRLALLARTTALFRQVADLSTLQDVPGAETGPAEPAKPR